MKKFWLIMVVFGFALQAVAQQAAQEANGPVITFEKKTHDFVLGRKGRQYKILQQQCLVVFRIHHQQLEIPRAKLDQEMVLMNEFFIKTFVSDLFNELIVEGSRLQILHLAVLCNNKDFTG